MESVVSFALILAIYFLGFMSITQGFIKPVYKSESQTRSNHAKIIGISLGSAMVPTLLLYSLVVI